MASVDLRIRRAALRSRERWALYEKKAGQLPASELDEFKALYEKQDLDELRELLEDEIYNMQERFTRVLRIQGRITLAERRIFVKHLHMLTFDETYRDREAGSKNDRSRKRIESLIVLCHDDEAFFLQEYVRALEIFFPVGSWSSCYVWKPRLFQKKLKSGKTRTSLKHHMGYTSPEPVEP